MTRGIVKPSLRARKNREQALKRKKALQAVGARDWEEVARWMSTPGRALSTGRPALQVATYTWSSNKSPQVIPQGGGVYLFTSFPPGNADYNRHSNKTVTYKYDARMKVTFPAAYMTSSFVLHTYFWLVYDKSPSGTLPTASTIFDTFYVDFPNTWTISRDVCHRFVVKHKWVTRVYSNANGATYESALTSPLMPCERDVPVNKFFKGLGVATEWKNSTGGDIGDIKNGALYLVVAGDRGKNITPLVYGKFRVYFKSVGLQ